MTLTTAPRKGAGMRKTITGSIHGTNCPCGTRVPPNTIHECDTDRIAELEAALAERYGMLWLAEERVLSVLPTFSPTTAKLIRKVFADIRARAREGAVTKAR